MYVYCIVGMNYIYNVYIPYDIYIYIYIYSLNSFAVRVPYNFSSRYVYGKLLESVGFLNLEGLIF